MKKSIIYYSFFLFMFLWACNDDFLERYPLDEVSMQTYWKTEADLASWTNSLYDMTSNPINYRFDVKGWVSSDILLGNGFDRGNTTGWYSALHRDYSSDNYASMHDRAVDHVRRRTGTGSIPGGGWDRTYNFGGWWWFLIRPINIFLENYENALVTDEVKYKYGGLVSMFRAWFYYDKVCHYGDVPLITKPLDVTDTLFLYGPREKRELVMELVLKDIDFACENMPENWNNGSPGYMNRWSALALKSRICLFEGTWRKYHGGADADKWLNEAAKAAKEIIDHRGFSLYSTGNPTTDYRFSYHQKDLKANPEVIYWKKYVDGMNPHDAHSYWVNGQGGMTRSALDDYLCTDGLPISLSPLYMGDDNIESVFINRDPRLRQTVLHPDDTGPNNPLHFNKGDVLSYPRLNGMSGGIRNYTGYQVIKFYRDEDMVAGANHNELAAIIFGYNEVLLNYAEAKTELGTITQSDLDISINKLRERVGMPGLNMNNIPDDPLHNDMNVSDLLVEVRRERRVELFGDGFRYDDLRRWKLFITECSKPASYQGLRWNDAAISRYVGANVKSSIDPNNGKTYIDVFKGTAFDPIKLSDKDYLWPIPTFVLTDNPNLGQNPGW